MNADKRESSFPANPGKDRPADEKRKTQLDLIRAVLQTSQELHEEAIILALGVKEGAREVSSLADNLVQKVVDELISQDSLKLFRLDIGTASGKAWDIIGDSLIGEGEQIRDAVENLGTNIKERSFRPSKLLPGTLWIESTLTTDPSNPTINLVGEGYLPPKKS